MNLAERTKKIAKESGRLAWQIPAVFVYDAASLLPAPVQNWLFKRLPPLKPGQSPLETAVNSVRRSSFFEF